jgi:hypothetical protein
MKRKEKKRKKITKFEPAMKPMLFFMFGLYGNELWRRKERGKKR